MGKGIDVVVLVDISFSLLQLGEERLLVSFRVKRPFHREFLENLPHPSCHSLVQTPNTQQLSN